MQRLQTAYTVYFNLRHRRAGHLMQGRYGAQLVQGDEYLLKLSRYIHLNPAFVADAAARPLDERIRLLRAYRWSSYRGYAGLAVQPEFVERAPILAGVAGRRNRQAARIYRKFVEAGLARTDEEFVEVLKNAAWGIGDDDFLRKVQEAHQEALRASRRPEDVALRRARANRQPDAVLAAVGRVFGVKSEQLRKRSYGLTARLVAMAALGKHAGLNQREIATLLRVGTGSAVCRAVNRLKQQRAWDKSLDRLCHAVDAELDKRLPPCKMSNGKG